MPRRPQYTVLGAGNNGAVIQAGPGVVYKYTRDPVEVASWLAVAGQQRRKPLPGMPILYDVHLGDRAAVITREDIHPLGARHGLDPYSLGALQTAARLDTKGRLYGDRRAALAARRIRSRGLYGPLRAVGRAINRIERVGAHPSDLRPDNFGRTARGLVLHDPGRSPVDTTIARSKGEYNECPNNKKLTGAVRDILGHAPSYKSCNVVNDKALRKVMRGHGWRDAEISDTAGFHSQDNVIYLLRGNEWSQLHELVHAAGVVDKDLCPWATEGITEAVAQDIAKQKKWKHHSTYPEYVKIVRTKLAPALGLKPLQVGEIVASDPKHAGRNLAKRLSLRTQIPERQWYKTLGPGNLSPQKFTTLLAQAS